MARFSVRGATLATVVALLGLADGSFCRHRYCSRYSPSRCKTSHHVHDHTSVKEEDMEAILSKMGLRQAVPPSRQKQKQRTRKVKKLAHHQKVDTSSSFVVPGKEKISMKNQLNYARNGHTALRGLLDTARLKDMKSEINNLVRDKELQAWKQKVEVACGRGAAQSCKTVQDCQDQLEAVGIQEILPFLQYFNTWRGDIPAVKDLAYALGPVAATLLDVPSVRLYQDAIFWKRKDDGPTPWHVDARMAPFDTSNICTIWIPLQPIPKDGSALHFCSKSHADFALPYWNPLSDAKGEDSEWNRLEDRYPSKVVHYMPMALGDVTVHSGWTLHWANGGKGDSQDRLAIAISYVDAKAEVRPNAFTTGDNEDNWSYRDWVKDVNPRTRIRHPMVPIVYPL